MANKKRELRPISFSGEETIFENRYLRLFRIEVDFGEFVREYFVSAKGQKVGTMVWKDNKILLVRQYRFAINDMSWELPGGGVEPGESLERAAMRECFEEAGVECKSVKPFFSFPHSVDVTISPAHIFEATGIASEAGLSSNGETDDIMWVPADECIGKIVSGEIREPMTMIALLMHAATRM
jgi:ADP-ribose pyrophosphatase